MPDDRPADTPRKLSFFQQMESFPATFWVANVIELVERFSFYGVRTIAALYIVETAEKGGLELSNTDKGIFFGTWALIQCLLPMFTGGFADRYGYRLSLMVAFGINIIGYGMMGFTSDWWGFMIACCLIGTGTAIFKPPLHGTLAHCVNESNSSVGWGMFYQVVNIGGFIGPFVCGYLRLLEWRYAFFAAAGIIVVNILITLIFLKDYAKGKTESEDKKRKSAGEVFAESLDVIMDLRFMVFLGIFSGFWFMFMQLFDQLSVFIDQWVDSSNVANFLYKTTGWSVFERMINENNGQVNPEWMVNVDAGTIILLVLLISYITGKFKPISAMIIGMFISCAGFLMAGSVSSGWLCVLAIVIFAIGEMACSPKFSEYIGLMAPPEKKALYMGYSNIPFAIGWAGANFIGGPMYDRLSDKYELARRYLVDELGQAADAVKELGKSDVMSTLATVLEKTENGAREVLWNHYHPQLFWEICTGVGLLATFGMVGYHFWLKADAKKRGIAEESA
ncbi:MAG: MFS transporter [Planctomycetota bacterium]